MQQNALYSLLGMTMVAVVLAISSPILTGRLRRTYKAGLAAAVIAYLIAMPIGVTLQWLALSGTLDQGTRRLIAPFIDPTIEETVRISFVSLVLASVPKESRVWPTALAFGFGYGLLESVAKLWDFLLQSSPLDPARLAAILSTPMVVLLLHVFLSLIAFSLAARGWRWTIVFSTTFVVHSAHNASVFWLPPPTDIKTLLLSNLSRGIVFGVLICLCVASMRRGSKAAKRLAPAPAE